MLSVEHVAWQVQDPAAVAQWYVANLGFRVLRKIDSASKVHFLADAAGRCVLEIYNNPAASVPDYPPMNPLHLHLAFVTDDCAATRDALVEAGAKVVEALRTTPAGDQLVMLTDPWGFAVQLVMRAKALR